MQLAAVVRLTVCVNPWQAVTLRSGVEVSVLRAAGCRNVLEPISIIIKICQFWKPESQNDCKMQGTELNA